MKWKCKMYYPPSWSQNVHPSPIWLIRCTGAWCTTGISSGDKRCNAEIWGVNITCSISVLLFETSWCLQQTCSYTERHMLCEHCKDIQVTVEHIKVLLVSAKGPARNLSSLILLKVQIISICWNVFTDVSADSHFGVCMIFSRSNSNKFLLLLLFLTPFDFVTSFDICRQNGINDRFCVFFCVCVVFLTLRSQTSLPTKARNFKNPKTSVFNIFAAQHENSVELLSRCSSIHLHMASVA